MAFRLLRAQKSADLTGKSVLITGAANGIGAATARQLSARGALVAMLDRDGEALQTAATACKGPTVTLVADVTDRADLDAAVCHLVDRVGRIDVVVANAGIVGPIATMTTVDPAAFEEVIDVDLVGVFRTLSATLPHVIDSGGYVLLVSSMAAIMPTPTFAAYGAAKAGVEAIGRALALELAHTSTAVGVAYFGVIDTDMVNQALRSNPGIDAILNAPGRFGAPTPVDSAAHAIITGIARRSRWVFAPRWVGALMLLRTQVALIDPLIARLPLVAAAIRGADISQR
jgi:NAD(P)-dependent dehydrogenase (short-subunit alcohol dehydrogenase family)